MGTYLLEKINKKKASLEKNAFRFLVLRDVSELTEKSAMEISDVVYIAWTKTSCLGYAKEQE